MTIPGTLTTAPEHPLCFPATHGHSRDTLASLRSTATTPAPLGVRIPMVEPQHEPPPLGLILVTNRDTWEWGGRPLLPIVDAVGFGRPPYSGPLSQLLDTLLFWKTTQSSMP